MAINNYSRVSPGVYRGPNGKLITPGGGSVSNYKPTAAAPAPAPAPVQSSQPRFYEDVLGDYRGAKDFASRQRFRGELRTAQRRPVAPVAAAPQAPVGDPPPPAMNDFYRNAFFSALRQPKVEASPMYDWQLQQGQQALDRQLSARALSNSGAAITANTNMVQGLAANEAQRQQQQRNLEGDRLERILQNEQRRQDDFSNRASDDMFRTLQLALGTFNPGEVSQGAQLLGSMDKELANAFKSYLQTQAPARGPGPGAFVPPFATSPDRGVSGQLAAIAGANNNAGYGNIINTIISSLL